MSTKFKLKMQQKRYYITCLYHTNNTVIYQWLKRIFFSLHWPTHWYREVNNVLFLENQLPLSSRKKSLQSINPINIVCSTFQWFINSLAHIGKKIEYNISTPILYEKYSQPTHGYTINKICCSVYALEMR